MPHTSAKHSLLDEYFKNQQAAIYGVLYESRPSATSELARREECGKMAKASGNNMLRKLAKILERNFEVILAYLEFDNLSTGPLEGANNKFHTDATNSICL